MYSFDRIASEGADTLLRQEPEEDEEEDEGDGNDDDDNDDNDDKADDLKPQPDHLRCVFQQRNLPYFFLGKPACIVGIPGRLKFTCETPAQKIYQDVVIENSATLIAK